MKEFQYTVKDACGIHARPAGLLVKLVKGYASTATLEKGGKTCVKVEGDDEAAAAEAIQKFLSENV